MPEDLDTSSGSSAEIHRPPEQMGRTYSVVTPAKFDCDEVTDEGQFPTFGWFLSCHTPDEEPVWVELPKSLETTVGELAEEAGGGTLEKPVFRVLSVSKNVEGSWQYQLEWFEDFDAASESLSSD